MITVQQAFVNQKTSLICEPRLNESWDLPKSILKQISPESIFGERYSNQQCSGIFLCLPRPDIDTLFDSVMVMDDDPTVIHNRLSLLRAIADDFRHFADFTILST